jgi:hypothetical protein
MTKTIPVKFLDLMSIEIDHFVNHKDSENCERCNKLIEDLNRLKLK